jgi:CrcB protein
MIQLSSVILVAAGGYAGAVTRYHWAAAVSKRFPSLLPYGTLSINALGSLLLGVLAGHGFSDSAKLLLGTGFMGAFTTFSTFKLESVKLAQQRQWAYFWLYQLLSYSLGIILAFCGFYIL